MPLSFCSQQPHTSAASHAHLYFSNCNKQKAAQFAIDMVLYVFTLPGEHGVCTVGRPWHAGPIYCRKRYTLIDLFDTTHEEGLIGVRLVQTVRMLVCGELQYGCSEQQLHHDRGGEDA